MLSDRVVNTLKGVAIGDAFCVGSEFRDRFWIQDNLSFESFSNHRAKGFRENLEPGAYSDDTEHTIGVVRALLSTEEFSASLLLRCFREEYEADKEQKGYGRQGHGSILQWYEGKATIEQVREQQAVRSDPGNAPVMRVLPLAFLPSDVINDYATINTDCTHPHPLAREACITAARIAEHFLVRGGSRLDVVSYVSQFVGPKTREDLRRVSQLPGRGALTDSDWEFLCGPQPIVEPPLQKYGVTAYGLNCQVSKTVLSALYVLMQSNNANEALRNSAFMGGDIDSLAAYTVGIMGGLTGLDSLPQFLLTSTEGLSRIESLATEFSRKLVEKRS